MFELATGIGFIQARPEEVLDIYNSINRSTVAAPNKTPEAAQAFIISVYREGLYHVYIHLYLSVSNEGLLYTWSEGGAPGDRLNDVYQAAFEFAESMGFMMDNMRYREKTPAEKTEAHRQVPAFHSDLSNFKGSAEDKVEELLIESLDDAEDEEIQLEAVEDEEEINLEALTDEDETAEEEDEDEVQEIMLGADAEESVELGAGLEVEPMEEADSTDEEDALDALEMTEDPAPAEAVEEDLLDALEIGEEPVPAAEPIEMMAEPVEMMAEPVEMMAEPVEPMAEPVEMMAEPVEPMAEPVEAEAEDDEEELALDNLIGEDTMEGATLTAPVVEEEIEQLGDPEEVSLTPEEALVLGTLESPDEVPQISEEEIMVDQLEPVEPLSPAAPDEMTEEIDIPMLSPEPPGLAAPIAPAPPPIAPAPFAPPVPRPAAPASRPAPGPKVAAPASEAAPPPGSAPLMTGEMTPEEEDVLARFLAMM